MEKILTASYILQVKKKVDMLKSIIDANSVLQTRGYTSTQGRYEFDLIIKEVR